MMAPAVTGAFVLATPSATTRPMAAATACRGGSALLALGRVRGGGWNPRTNRRDTQLFFQRQPTRGGGGGKGSSTPTTTSTTPKPPAVPTEGEAVVVGTEVEDSEPLTLTSAIALVAGTTVGAGILALPGTYACLYMRCL